MESDSRYLQHRTAVEYWAGTFGLDDPPAEVRAFCALLFYSLMLRSQR